MDSATWWTAFGAIAQALGALATFVAVAVALWETRSERRLTADVRVGILVSFMGDGSPGMYHVGFTILNTSLRPLRVSTVGWRTGWLRRAPKRLAFLYAIQNSSMEQGAQLPKTLEPNESATILIPVHDFKLGASDAKRRAEFFGRTLPLLGKAPIRAIVSINGRRDMYVQPTAELCEFLRTNAHPSTTAEKEQAEAQPHA